MHFLRRPHILFAALLLATALTPALAAGQAFTVQKIDVQGLERISTGTVYTYLPISVGDTVNAQRVAGAIKALYKTGFFSNIKMRRAGHTLIVDVTERPSIARFKIKGNKKIKTKDIKKPLKKMGLTRGRIFSRSLVNKVKQQLQNLYIQHGKYNAKVDVDIKNIGNNRVAVTINISEGVNTTIRSINIVGNKTFDDSTLISRFKLQPTHWYSFFQSSDNYVSETLSGDLESLRSFYMDRGYADFHINSVQVTISPDYKHIFITINVHEGAIYKFSKIDYAGQFVVPKEKLAKLAKTKPGQTFSMGEAQKSADLMTNLMGSKGYAFAKVQPVPKLDRKHKLVTLTYVAQPGQRVYVRHVNFNGMPGTDDVVFRREMRQLEGGWLTNQSLKRSKFLIKRLPIVKKVEESTDQIPGSNDMVDLNYQLTGRQAGTFMAGIGYSGYYGVGGNISIQHYNFLGEGDVVNLRVVGNEVSRQYSFGWTDPYVTVNGVSRSIGLHYRNSSSLLRTGSSLDIKSYGVNLAYGVPLSDFSRLSFGGAASRNDVVVTTGSSLRYILFALNPNNGDLYGSPVYITPNGLQFYYRGIRYDQYKLSFGYSYNSLNRALFPDKGVNERFNITASLPFSDIRYYKATFRSVNYVPLVFGFTYLLDGSVGINKTYETSTQVPPNESFFVGGPESVRGYKNGYVGPIDERGYPAGGNFEIYARNEFILPSFGGDEDAKPSFRLSLFYDIGSAFTDESDFETRRLLKSTGVAVQMMTPMGLTRMSYAWPLSDVPGSMKEEFQFTVGRRF